MAIASALAASVQLLNIIKSCYLKRKGWVCQKKKKKEGLRLRLWLSISANNYFVLQLKDHSYIWIVLTWQENKVHLNSAICYCCRMIKILIPFSYLIWNSNSTMLLFICLFYLNSYILIQQLQHQHIINSTFYVLAFSKIKHDKSPTFLAFSLIKHDKNPTSFNRQNKGGAIKLQMNLRLCFNHRCYIISCN